MRVVSRIVNRTEEIAFRELEAIASDNALRTFPKMRLSDVLEKGSTCLPQRVFDYFTRSHFDFLITDTEYKPLMAVEYDGPSHEDPAQMELDGLKNGLCHDGGLPLLRINANHVTRKFRGMSLLRWIIEVSQLQIAFDEAQRNCQIAFDEAFDPAMIISCGSKRDWPYWLAANANERIKEFLYEQPGEKEWISLRGNDKNNNLHSFEYIRAGDKFLHVKTAARSQDAAIPVFDMLTEITNCEMDEELAKYQRGECGMKSISEFTPVYDEVCRKYNMRRHVAFGIGLMTRY